MIKDFEKMIKVSIKEEKKQNKIIGKLFSYFLKNKDKQ